MWMIKFRSMIAMVALLLQSGVSSHVIEPNLKCSKFDFEEKLLEKVVRLEHSTNNMMDEFKEIALQVKDDLTATKTELTETKTQLEKEQHNSSRVLMEQFEDLSWKINSKFETMSSNLDETKREIEEARQTVLGFVQRSSYAFNAQWLKDTSSYAGKTLIFTRVPLNQNNVYSSTTGEYTVPVDGTYMFSTTLCMGGSNNWVKIKILADQTVVHVFMSGNLPNHMCTSTSVVGQLQKGTKVKIVVNNMSGSFSQYENDRMCTFSGFLIN